MVGDALVKNTLLNIFGLDKEDEDTFVARNLKGNVSGAKLIYGGFLFAQSLVAAQRTVGPEFLPHSMHSFFIFNASPLKPVVYKIQRIRDGRSFATRFVTAHQEDKIVFSIQISFHVKEEPAIFHQYTMPKAEPPENLISQWDIAKEYLDRAEAGELQIGPYVAVTMHGRVEEKKKILIEGRALDPEVFFLAVPNKSLTQLVWVRIRSPMSDNKEHHRAMAAFITDATLGATAVNPHVSQGFIPSMFFSLDNHCWFHTYDFRVDEWMLYESESPVANNGRALSLGRLWTRDGRLIFSSAQESLHRTKMADAAIVKNALLNIFGLDKEDENTFIARNLKGNQSDAKSVYGGFLFSQSLVVAQKTVGPGFLPHSMHSFFIFNASSSKPVVYKIQRIRDGRSFATRFVTAHQEDKIVFSIQISFHVKEEPAIFHQYTMPKAEPPENLKRQWDVAKEYAEKADAGELKINSNIRARMQWDIGSKNFSTIEWCPVNPEFFFSVVPNKSLTQLVWVRIRSPISDDREQHRALVAYITDATLGETGAKAHFSQGFIPSMFFSLDNHCWFHTDDFRVDEWMLYENESPVANNGRAFSLGRLWTRDGRLILSSAQESLHRTKIAKSSL